MAVINIIDFGADPSGVNDSLGPIQQACESLQEGDTLLIPPGEFRNLQSIAGSSESDTVNIGVDNVVVTGGGCLHGIGFVVAGSYGELAPIISENRKSITTSPSNVPAPGAYVQVLSGTNAFAPEARDYQGGSRSPSSDILYDVRFSEFATVLHVNAQSFSTTADLTFAGHLFGAGEPTFRQVRFRWGVRFRGLKFNMSGSKFFRTLQFRFAKDCAVEDCEFIASATPGRHIMAGDCLRLEIVRNLSRRSPSKDARGSSWNSFLIGGGCQDVVFGSNRVEGDWQAIDFTSYCDENLEQSGNEISNWRSTERIKIHDNYFANCHDGITTHPGTYFAQIERNDVRASGTGARVRSRFNTIQNNRFEARRSSLTMASFFHQSLITGNVLVRDGNYPDDRWAAFTLMFSSREVLSDNKIEGVLFASNLAIDRLRDEKSLAVDAYHSGLETEVARNDFSKVKLRESDVRFVANNFDSLPVRVSDHVNGLTFM